MRGGASFDDTGRYRYLLWRRWQTGGGLITFVMLNPSSADARREDPTIRRCMGFARRWGFAGLRVANLFAFRTHDPGVLARSSDPVGPANGRTLKRIARESSMLVAAWGYRGGWLGRDREFLKMLSPGTRVVCLGLTRTGQPRHPLYLPDDTVPVPFGLSAHSPGVKVASARAWIRPPISSPSTA